MVTFINYIGKKNIHKTIEKMLSSEENFLKTIKNPFFTKRVKKFATENNISDEQVNFKDFQSYKDNFLKFQLEGQRKYIKIVYIILFILLAISILRLLFLL